MSLLNIAFDVIPASGASSPRKSRFTHPEAAIGRHAVQPSPCHRTFLKTDGESIQPLLSTLRKHFSLYFSKLRLISPAPSYHDLFALGFGVSIPDLREMYCTPTKQDSNDKCRKLLSSTCCMFLRKFFPYGPFSRIRLQCPFSPINLDESNLMIVQFSVSLK